MAQYSRWSNLPTIAALLLACAGPPLLAIVAKRMSGAPPSIRILIVFQLVLCAFPGVVIFIVIRFERLPLSSIGLRPVTYSTVVSGFLLALGTLYAGAPSETQSRLDLRAWLASK